MDPFGHFVLVDNKLGGKKLNRMEDCLLDTGDDLW